MTSLADLVPLPPRDAMNAGLSACQEQTMLTKFGQPGELTDDCSDATGPFLKRVREGFDVGPFRVSGLDYAVELLKQLFSEVKTAMPDVFGAVKNDGMLCVRHRRKNKSVYSNHSWGTAIDLFFGVRAVPQGTHLAHRGNLLLMPYFNRYGWYWGAGFSGDSVDSMHFELSEETILKMPELTLAAS